MSAIHLSAVSISETSTELSLRVAPAFGGPCVAAALQCPSCLWQLRRATIKAKQTGSLPLVGSNPAVDIKQDGCQQARRSLFVPKELSFRNYSSNIRWFRLFFAHQSIKAFIVKSKRLWTQLLCNKHRKRHRPRSRHALVPHERSEHGVIAQLACSANCCSARRCDHNVTRVITSHLDSPVAEAGSRTRQVNVKY